MPGEPLPLELSYESDAAPIGQAIIFDAPDRLEIRIGPPDRKGWLAALLPAILLLASCVAQIYFASNRSRLEFFLSGIAWAFPLLLQIFAVWSIIETQGRCQIIVIENGKLTRRIAGLDGAGSLDLNRIMCVRCRRIPLLPTVSQVSVHAFPKWMKPRLAHDEKDDDCFGGLFVGSREMARQVFCAVSSRLPDHSPPPVKSSVKWIAVGGLIIFFLLGAGMIRQTIIDQEILNSVFWGGFGCIAIAFAFPITAIFMVDAGKLRQQPESAPGKQRQSLTIEGLPPRTMN